MDLSTRSVRSYALQVAHRSGYIRCSTCLDQLFDTLSGPDSCSTSVAFAWRLHATELARETYLVSRSQEAECVPRREALIAFFRSHDRVQVCYLQRDPPCDYFRSWPNNCAVCGHYLNLCSAAASNTSKLVDFLDCDASGLRWLGYVLYSLSLEIGWAKQHREIWIYQADCFEAWLQGSLDSLPLQWNYWSWSNGAELFEVLASIQPNLLQILSYFRPCRVLNCFNFTLLPKGPALLSFGPFSLSHAVRNP